MPRRRRDRLRRSWPDHLTSVAETRPSSCYTRLRMAHRTTPPFRADHVGSLLRPPALLQAREDHAAGRIDDDELRAIEDDAVREAVKMQEDVGLRVATDGEFRRASWHMDFIYQLGGVVPHPEERHDQGLREARVRGRSRRGQRRQERLPR